MTPAEEAYEYHVVIVPNHSPAKRAQSLNQWALD
jgi:hypothetical protein